MPLFQTTVEFEAAVPKALELLNAHYIAFDTAKEYADETGHTVPSDTKSWSEILVSVLTGLRGLERKKGSDLEDGSDVKAANVWSAIDTPRFNGVSPSGRTTAAARKPDDVTAFDTMPFLFFVLWDHQPPQQLPRCRIWVVRPAVDPEFRRVAGDWYAQRRAGIVRSNNFQLHPPRNLNTDVIRHSCGSLVFPLFFSAVRREDGYELETFNPEVLRTGECTPAS